MCDSSRLVKLWKHFCYHFSPFLIISGTDKGKTMKGVRTVGGGSHNGGGIFLFFFFCEGGWCSRDKKRPRVLYLHKRWSSLCDRGGFPFTEIGCSTTREQISPSSLLCLSLSLTVTHLFLHCISV